MSDFAPFAGQRLLPAEYLDRPNRFVVHCRLEDGQRVRAFLPNPGRMWELLLPGAHLQIVEAPAGAGAGGRRTRFTAVAVERAGAPVLLDTHRTNRVARHLIESGLVPGLEGATIAGAEVAVGRSRFDFLLRQGRREAYLEVKSCTLFGNRVAMFPDAVTERGRRHLAELAHLGERGTRPAVLFVVHSWDVDWFMPDYHTDLEFSRAFLEVRRDLRILPVAVRWQADLTLSGQTRLLPVPWAHLQREVADRGSYLLVMRLPRPRRLQVGQLGTHLFPAGHWVYVGSAMRALSARVARHLRHRKTCRWHVDYLRAAAGQVVALPVRSSRRQECDLARAVARLLDPGPTGFGSSDCSCPTHLFHSAVDPLARPDFHVLLQSFRMRPPGSVAVA